MNLRPQIALDIGTAQTKGLNSETTVTCPSVVLRDLQSDQTVAVGREVESQSLKPGWEKVYPVKGGVMNHYSAGQALIRYVMNQLLPWWTLMRPTVILSRSQLARPAQLQQVRQAARLAGGGSVFAADTTALAALGAGLQPDDPTATLVVDIGAGTTEAAVIVRATPVVKSAESVGGNGMAYALCDYCRDKYGTELTTDQARSVIADIGSAVEVNSVKGVSVEGSDELQITTNDIAKALDTQLEKITQLIQGVMRDSSAALLSDVAEEGVILTGGVAQLRNLETHLSRRLSVPVNAVSNPESAVVRGASRAHKFVDIYRESAKRHETYKEKQV